MADNRQPIDLSYELTGTGWSAASIRIGTSETRLTTSYLTDALGDLLRAVQDLANGTAAARASWEEEPGEYRWVFQQNGGLVSLRILAFDHLYSDAGDDFGEELISGTVTVSALVQATAAAARRVLDHYGPVEYQRAWVKHPFPEEALRTLEAFSDED